MSHWIWRCPHPWTPLWHSRTEHMWFSGLCLTACVLIVHVVQHVLSVVQPEFCQLESRNFMALMSSPLGETIGNGMFFPWEAHTVCFSLPSLFLLLFCLPLSSLLLPFLPTSLTLPTSLSSFFPSCVVDHYWCDEPFNSIIRFYKNGYGLIL